MVCKFFDKGSTGSGIESMPNQQFADELRKPFIINLNENKTLLVIPRQYLGSWFSLYAMNKQMQKRN